MQLSLPCYLKFCNMCHCLMRLRLHLVSPPAACDSSLPPQTQAFHDGNPAAMDSKLLNEQQ